LRPHLRTSFHHQPEAQHPKSSAIHKNAGRLPHLWGNFGHGGMVVDQQPPCIGANGRCGRGLLHPEGQNQAHRRFQAGQGSGRGNPRLAHFFGEGCLHGHPLRVTTATAIEQSLITRIPKAKMMVALHEEPEFSELFMADLLSRNSRIEEDLIDQLFNSSEKRLARVLLLLANFGKETTVEPIIGKFSQETLAEMIGTTRSRVSFFMNKFRKLGYIEYNGKLEIRNSLLNVVLYDKPEIRKDDANNGPMASHT
jgi:hypothetical protein